MVLAMIGVVDQSEPARERPQQHDTEDRATERHK
jgi:hypothetical protein